MTSRNNSSASWEGIDIEWLRPRLKSVAHFTFEPLELLERKIVRELMPQLVELRAEGFSLEQIVQVFIQLEVNFRPASFRMLYEEELFRLMGFNSEKSTKEAQSAAPAAASQCAPNAKLTAGQERPSTEGQFGLLVGTHQAGQNPNSGEPATFKCLPLQPDVVPFPRRAHVPDFVYMEGFLEHPAIPGLTLTMEERIYGAYLELVDQNGEIRLESVKERPFRIKWTKPIPMTIGSTDKDFVDINPALFKKRSPPI